MATPVSSGVCPINNDDQFGPRVAIACRSFDFTLLFEDAFFVALPAALFLVLLPLRLQSLYKAPVKVTSYQLATWKLSLIAVMLVSHLLFLVFRLGAPALHTRLAVSSGVLGAAATLAAGIRSFFEDQRSLKPSDLLVLYFSVSTVLYIPRLRTLWMMPSADLPKAMWTVVFVGTAVLVFVESAKKTRFLRPSYRSATTEQTTGFWSRSFFFWVLPFFRAGYAKVLQPDDIPRVDGDLEEHLAWSRLDSSWHKTSHGRHRLVRAAFRANIWAFLSAVPPRLALAAFSFSQPFLIEASVKYMNSTSEERENDNNYGQALVGAFILAYLGIAVSRAVYWRQTYRLLAKIRSGLIASVYRHTTSLQATAVKDSAAITLMGTDVERIVHSMRLLHELWASIPEVAIGIWLLARQLGVASVVPMVICLASLAGASPIAARFGPAQRTWVERVEKRVAVTASMLGDMKAVKMLGLSRILETIILRLRVAEMKTSEKFRGLFVWQIMVGNTPMTLAPFVTFSVYTIISVVREDEGLLGAQAFASISLISLVTMPVMMFCQALPNCMQAAACFGRIEKYLLKEWPASPDLPSPTMTSEHRDAFPLQQQSAMLPPDSTATHIKFVNADISWSRDAPEPVLEGLNLEIRPGLTAIIGPVASGKSTLLASMIGETVLKKGSVTPSSLSGVAFCAQTPWIMNDSIRQNITGGLEFDQKWYEFSVSSSGLQDDIDRMPKGDQTRAGSNGSSLSGGQRQRVALARAIYSRLPVVVLDDVMSGLDAKTISLVATRLFGAEGHFRRAGISVVLATHSRRLLPHMDRIVVLGGGKVVETGSYEDILVRSADLVAEAEATLPVGDGNDSETDEKMSRDTPADASVVIADAEETAQQTDLTRQNGSWSVYKYYTRSAGVLTVFCWMFFTVMGAVFTNVMPIWVDRWTASNETAPNQHLGFYLGVYSVFVVLSNLGVALECWTFFIRVINNTALKLHSDLLESTFRAPFSFFQTTDAGAITNRFSQDMDLIDMTLPTQAIQFTTGAASCLVQLLIICVLAKYLAAAIPVLAGVLFLVQRYYLRTSRQVRLIDIEAKAPLYKHFIETAQGVATIRAFRWGAPFHKRHAEMLNNSQRPFYMLLCVQQWLSLVLDLIVGALAAVLVAVATSTVGSLSAGSLGVSLVLILEFNSLLTQTIQAWTKLETSIGAVARVQQFVQDTPSEPSGDGVPHPEWPTQGIIRFHGVAAGYSPESPLVLADVNLAVNAGEKLAVCGPSGSGKTSLIMTLLRMISLSEGHIAIDGADIAGLRGDDVRARLNVVPQEPYFMPGTVRFNLDPREQRSDDEMEAAIRRVGLWSRVADTGGLNANLDASEWSQGERQLLCLARAILVKSNVLILDEATSSVDGQTEAIMQGVIESEFSKATVISVLHRFTFIDKFDRVAVFRDGRLVECDEPTELLGRESVFAGLYRAHHGK